MKRRLLSMEVAVTEANLVERNAEPQGICLVNPYKVGDKEKSDLVKLAEEIQKADSIVRASTCSKLQVIAEQIKFLQEEAKHILWKAKENTDLHHVACNFHKVPGNTYYLYQRKSGQKYFSMLSPQDWSGQDGPPHTYIGAYILENDMSWTPEGDIKKESLPKISKMINVETFACLTYGNEDPLVCNDLMDTM